MTWRVNTDQVRGGYAEFATVGAAVGFAFMVVTTTKVTEVMVLDLERKSDWLVERKLREGQPFAQVLVTEKRRSAGEPVLIRQKGGRPPKLRLIQ